MPNRWYHSHKMGMVVGQTKVERAQDSSAEFPVTHSHSRESENCSRAQRVSEWLRWLVGLKRALTGACMIQTRWSRNQEIVVVSQSACWESTEMLMTRDPEMQGGQRLTIGRCLPIPNSPAPHTPPEMTCPPRKLGGNGGIKSDFIEFKYEMTGFA